MGLYKTNIENQVQRVVEQHGLNAVVQEMQRQEEEKRKIAVAELDAAILRFGTTLGIPVQQVQQYLFGTTPTGRQTSEPAMQSIKPAKAKPTPADIGKVAPSTISSEGWDFITQNYSRNLKDGHTVVNLVGQHYRGPKDQETLAGKKMHNMALLVAEPTNPADINAVMVLMWDWTAKIWRHVGYVKADQAAKLRSTWPEDDVRKVQVASITEMPANFDGHRGSKNLKLTITGEYRTYPTFQRLV